MTQPATPDSRTDKGVGCGELVLPPLNDDDLSNLWTMYQTVMGGGVAPVNDDEAKRLEALGMVKLFPASEEDAVAGEIEPEYTFTLTKAGGEAARAYRASWQNVPDEPRGK